MNLSPTLKAKSRLIQAWKTGVDGVSGKRVTADAMARDRGVGWVEPVTDLLAVGKAAASMCVGALDYFAVDARALVVTKYGHGDAVLDACAGVEVIEAGHPLPDENSLRAGRVVDEFVASSRGQLVMLVSGGASALVERLLDGIDLDELQAMNTELLAGGYAIEQVNAVRMQVSTLKGGKLLRGFGGESVRVYVISDVQGDDVDVIGGGIGGVGSSSVLPTGSAASSLPQDVMRLLERCGDDRAHELDAVAFDYDVKVIGSNQIARECAAEFLLECGMEIIVNEESMYHDVHAVAQQIAAELLKGSSGAYIWGGEPTVILPPKSGVGGRNQSLALALAKEIRGQRNISVLVAGTDGTDGPTNAAGALVDGDTFTAASGANNALLNADAGTYLARIAALFKPGVTGTNVMDMVIAIKQ